MFAVCEHTTKLQRCMQILTFLNTDATFRNLLLYGIEDTHYQLEDTKVTNSYGENIIAAERLETGELNYLMDVNKTGNTLIAYPEAGTLATFHDHAIVQNQDAKVRLDLGFKLDDKVDKESLEEIRKLSAKILGEYNAWTFDQAFDADGEFKSEEFDNKFAEFIDAKNAEIANDENVKANVTCQSGETHSSSCKSLYCCYHSWLKSNKIIK